MEFTLTFKEVGHGDSIIIEWSKSIGIIDCNKKGASNPILNYLSTSSITEIEFIILSHPHIDHFSGFEELLEYCEKQGILIKKFCYTILSQLLGIIQSNESLHDFLAFARLLELIDRLYSKKLITQIIELDSTTKNMLLHQGLDIEVLGPGFDEKKSLINLQKDKPESKKLSKTIDLNRISTVLKINLISKKQYILLTSDATKGLLKTIMAKSRISKEETLLLGQVPHHGSKFNHELNFWNKLTTNAIVVFSCGNSPLHSLPDREVVVDFERLGYDIHSTNAVNGILSSHQTDETEALDVLDLISELSGSIQLSPDSKLSGDQRFSFNAC